MIKSTIKSIFTNGFSRTSKPAEEVFKGLPRFVYEDIIETAFENGEPIGLRMKYCEASFGFWRVENMHRRHELCFDILRVRRTSAGDGWFFEIINRFANGDRYGIVKKC